MEHTQVGYPLNNGALVRAKVAHARRILDAEQAVRDAESALSLAKMRLQLTKENGALNHG